MDHHGLQALIPMLLVEDKTKIKARLCWEHRLDALIGFCRPKEDHICIPTFKVVVGEGELKYNRILDAFAADKVGGFARVIMICLLHDKLPRLVLTVTCTYRCFYSNWVHNQWDCIDALWDFEVLHIVGSIVGHANNGDSWRCQLMLADYLQVEGGRFFIPWDGWLLLAKLNSNGRIHGLHDQDFIHNRKKLINPLDSPVKTLQLGGDNCYLEHLRMVYN